MAISKGDKIRVHYKGTLDDGTVFDDSRKRGEPLEFTVGEGELIAGFDDAVLGMNPGDTKSFRLEEDEAYGTWRQEAVHNVPRSMFPPGQTPVLGMTVAMSLPNGTQVPALIAEVKDDEIALDLNHPLAGKALTFSVEIVSVPPPAA